MIDWLIYLLIEWLFDWMNDWLIELLIDWLQERDGAYRHLSLSASPQSSLETSHHRQEEYIPR